METRSSEPANESLTSGSGRGKLKHYELAPLASFEDLEEFKPPKPIKTNCLPIIDDCETQSSNDDKFSVSTNAVVTPVSIQTSGSDNITPPTPRIDISCASTSSSTISDELPSSEREFLKYGLGIEVAEIIDDLRSSTEELAFEEESNLRPHILKKQESTTSNDFLRRASHPANIFRRKPSTPTISEHFTRKPSVYSLRAEPTSPNYSHKNSPEVLRHNRSCAPSPSPTIRSGRRSVSPHLFMLETSFCGNRPREILSDDEVIPILPSPVDSVGTKSHCCDIISTQVQVESVPVHRRSIHISEISAFSHSFNKSIESNFGGSEGSEQLNNEEKVTENDQDENISKPLVLENSDLQNAAISPETPEKRGLFHEESLIDEDTDLPYVPTTLPLEKSIGVSIVPIKDRSIYYAPTTPISRPRRQQPPNLTSIEDFISNSSTTHSNVVINNSGEKEKMKICLPKDDSLGEEPCEKSRGKKESLTTWTNFAEMGLRNPRNSKKHE